MQQQYPEPLVKKKFLLLLLDSIDNKIPLSTIAGNMGRTKQALNYHIQKYRKLGLLNRVQQYPYSIYELTSLGRRVKQSLRQSEHPKALWKAHNLIVGFEILHLGNFNFVETTRRKLIKMKNWSYAREEVGNFVINIQDTGLLKIYAPAKYTTDPDVAFGEMFAECQKVAQWYCHRYEMKLRPMKVIRKGEKALVRSEKLAKIFGRVKLEQMYINASEGTEELEAPMDSYSIEKLLRLPEIIENQLNPALERFSKNIELHLEVLQNIQKAIEKLSEVNESIQQRN